MNIDMLLPTLFSKTFFLLGLQLFMTCLAIHIVFQFLKRVDPQLKNAALESDAQIEKDCNPKYQWLFKGAFQQGLLFSWLGLFFLLRFWGIDQTLSIAISLFTAWSFLTGVWLEFILITFDRGLGRRIIALTAIVTITAGLIGYFSKVDLGFLRVPLFLGLTGLLGFYIIRLFGGMRSVRQKVISTFGIGLFTLYLVYDFNVLAKAETEDLDNWREASILAMKIYLDIINLLLHMLSKNHH